MARTPGGPSGPSGDMSWEEIWERLTGKAREVGEKQGQKWPWKWILVIIAVVIWLLTGIYTVGPGEEGVVKRFGKHIDTTGPGLHYHIPSPIESVTRVNVEEIRTAEIGFRTISKDQFQFQEKEARMLTGDENIVEAQVVVQYRVKDSADYLFNIVDPQQVLHDATEVALRSVVGDNTIDFVMIEERTTVQTEVMIFLQELLDSYESGLLITTLELQEVAPPKDVEDAFNEVQRAREDKQTIIREAEGYAADLVPKSRGEAQKMLLQATAYKEQRVLKAEGDASKFLQILKEHEVPAAFQVLSEHGSQKAIDILEKLGNTSNLPDLNLDEITTEEIISEATGGGSPMVTSLQVQLVNELTRENLFNLLAEFGATINVASADELSGQKLVDTFASLNLSDQYLIAYRNAVLLTQQRLYLETMEEDLKEIEKYIIDSNATGNLMQFLPLKELSGWYPPDQSNDLQTSSEEVGK